MTTARSWSLGDVVGSLTAAALDGRPEDAPITPLIGPSLPTIGSGEVRGDRPAPLAVVTDGRVVTILDR